MNWLKAGTLFLLFSSSIAGIAQATLVASDSFDNYTAGNDLGGNGSAGGGWVSAWNSSATTLDVINGGLSYNSGVLVSRDGGTKSVSGGSTVSNTLANRQFNTISANSDVWFSLTYKPQAGLDTDDF